MTIKEVFWLIGNVENWSKIGGKKVHEAPIDKVLRCCKNLVDDGGTFRQRKES